MKRLSPLYAAVLVLLGTSFVATGQEREKAKSPKEAFEKLNSLLGQWEGNGWICGEDREDRFAVAGTATVQSRLSASLLVVEAGYSGTKGSTSQSIGLLTVVSFDAQAQRYRIHAYGGSTGQVLRDAEVRLKDVALEWSHRDPGGTNFRYTIKLTDKGEWLEVGEESLDGKKWTKWYEVTLRRKKEPSK